MSTRPPVPQGQPATIKIEREPWSDYFTITSPNGHSEELEVEETREWFRTRGANMDKLETVLDHVWNFRRAEVTIKNFRAPQEPSTPHAPRI